MTSSSAFPRAFLYRCALGPLFSNGGLKNWTLHLASDRIVGVSLGLWLSVKAGILAGIGSSPRAHIQGILMPRRNRHFSLTKAIRGGGGMTFRPWSSLP